ncbi:phage tail protein [Dickeya undicola]|uniref:Phage tail protein n=2 Tax=Dickeya undicola TaxID=1577887 RepID=A0A3N0FQC3_9GAMM|nr:phage tail protein [Dickeya undicola]
MGCVMLYSKSANSFFCSVDSNIPEDAVEINEELYIKLLSGEHAGKVLTSDGNGYPVLIERIITHDQQMKIAESQREYLAMMANTHINHQQWPSKLSLGRLSDGDKQKFNLWLDYVDTVNLIDTSTAPDINWPTPPAT